MARYSVETKTSPEGVISRAVKYFGEDGLGLSISAQDACCITFQGGGGHVSLVAAEEAGSTTVELETREWDYHVKRFMGQI